MATSRKVIITCAVTGAIHTPSMSPYLPITADEIAEGALGAAKAGAAIVHLHARDPVDGRPTQDPKYFEPFLKKIKSASNVVVNLTTGGAPTMLVEERLQPALRFKPEVASLNMGTMNFGLFEMVKRTKEFKHDWERPYPEDVLHMRRTADRLFGNDYVWSVLGAGRNQMTVATLSAAIGGNVRVGLEDSLWDGPGTLARSNAAQVTRIRTILEALSLEVATSDEARRILQLKGRDNVAF